MQKLRKAVIPAAGLGTRFLPATKSIPKELLPLVDRPILLYVVEEAVQAGFEDIILITGRGKEAIEDFFDSAYELEDQLEKKGQTVLLESLHRIKNMANVISVRQKQALGLGHAVACAEPIVGDQPFAVLLGDEVMVNDPQQLPVIGQLVHLFQQHQTSCVAVMEVEKAAVEKYGMIAKEDLAPGLFKVTSVVEKPTPESAPSQWALPGRYIFSPKIFGYLRGTRPGRNGEIQLTDAMTQLAQNDGLLASGFEARRFDAGDKLGFLQANVELALQHSELGERFKQYLKNLCSRL